MAYQCPHCDDTGEVLVVHTTVYEKLGKKDRIEGVRIRPTDLCEEDTAYVVMCICQIIPGVSRNG